MLAREHDAYGRLIFDHHRGRAAVEIVERDDGRLDITNGPAAYFAPFAAWPAHQRRAMRYVRGRVLDAGCGAGRVALHLQRAGLEVVAFDVSPLAVTTARLRGVRDARVLALADVDRRVGAFDTLVMLGNNFGLFGSPRRARTLLRRFRSLMGPDGRIVAETLNPYRGGGGEHRAYHRRNRDRGRMAGQVRIRVRFQSARTPWFDYLFVSPRELRGLVAGTGWRVEREIHSRGPVYVALLVAEPR